MRSTAIALLCAWVFAGCVDRARDEAATRGETADSAGPASSPSPPAAAPADSAAPLTAEVTLDNAPRIMVELREWRVRASADTMVTGDYAFVFDNRGERPHTIEVRGDNGARWRTIPIAPGTVVTLRMNLPPGHYQVASTDSAYVERGMRAAIVVVVP
jgi:hypothetical protein